MEQYGHRQVRVEPLERVRKMYNLVSEIFTVCSVCGCVNSQYIEFKQDYVLAHKVLYVVQGKLLLGPRAAKSQLLYLGERRMAINSSLRKSLLSAGVVVALGFGSSSAMALVLNDFDVNEGVVPGSAANTFTADKVTGNYVEVITFDPAGTFQVSLKWQAGQFVANDGVDPVVTQLNGFGDGGYGLYALYNGTGTWSAAGGVTTFVTDAGAGSFGLWLDPNQDTVFGQPADGSILWSTGLSADDLQLATGTPLPGAGSLDPSLPTCGAGGGVGINCGSFGTSVSFELTAFGMTYFVGPNPFYNISFQSGQLNNFDVAGTQLINGSMDVVFDTVEVPEPGTLALLGLAFAGLGFTTRRRKS